MCWVLMVARSLKSLFGLLPRVHQGFVVSQQAEGLARYSSSSSSSSRAFAPEPLGDDDGADLWSGGGGLGVDALAIASVRLQERMDAVRNWGLNLLFCTSVLKESIDVPTCALVASFDPPRTFTAFIQCKDRVHFASVYFARRTLLRCVLLFAALSQFTS